LCELQQKWCSLIQINSSYIGHKYNYLRKRHISTLMLSPSRRYPLQSVTWNTVNFSSISDTKRY
jgi:hypothetical protein